jgi:hypothetical protein
VSEVEVKHRIRWFVYVGPNSSGRFERIPRTASMRGTWPGYDVECSCGQKTTTGGAVRSYIEREVWLHKNVGSDLGG